MNRKTTYINFGGIDYWYHNRAHAELQIMTRLAQEDIVIFVNSIGMRTPTKSTTPQPGKRILRKLKSTLKYVRRPERSLKFFYVFSPIILPFYSSAFMRKVNARLIAIQVGLLAFIVGTRQRVVSVTIPTAEPVLEHLKYRTLVVHRFDKMSAFKGADRNMLENYEKQLLRRANVVLFSSSKLLKEEEKYCTGRALFFDHGVDLQLFHRTDLTPKDMQNIPHPIVGFFGGLDDHVVDFELLKDVAKTIDGASLVLIGDAPRDISDLIAYDNVYWLGKKQLKEIPSYGSHFDVAIMPFQKSSWLSYANPIKLKEYLSLGLPVVSTPMDEIARYSQIMIAESSTDFIVAIKNILADLDTYSSSHYRASLRDTVLNDDWDNRTQQYRSHITL